MAHNIPNRRKVNLVPKPEPGNGPMSPSKAREVRKGLGWQKAWAKNHPKNFDGTGV